MRSFKLGLSRPKHKRKVEINTSKEKEEIKTDNDVEEINVSRETIENISTSLIKKSIKRESQTSMHENNDKNTIVQCSLDEEYIENLVSKFSAKHATHVDAATLYDIKKQFEPVAGSSTVKICSPELNDLNCSDITLIESSFEENKRGIESFYDKSMFFDLSATENESGINDDESHPDENDIKTEHISIKNEIPSKLYLEEPMSGLDNITLVPKIRAPTKNYIISTLENYKIPKILNPTPYFSDHKDVGDKIEIGQMVLKLNSKLAQDQKPFEKVLDITTLDEWRQLLFLQTNEISEESSKADVLKTLLASNRRCILEPLKRPPLSSIVKQWVEGKDRPKTENITHQEINVDVDELENSQAIGLKEINSSLSLETTEKVKFSLFTYVNIK